MKKLESIAILIVIAILCPLLLFVLFWWGSAGLAMSQILPIPEVVIPITAFVGLAIGVFLDVLYLKKWVAMFYDAELVLMMLLYICCSIFAVAMFMGLPVGNLILGTLAGLYAGRRAYHNETEREAFLKKVKRTGLFTAIVTGLEALPIGIFALNEDWVVEWLKHITRMDTATVTGIFGIGMILVLCAVLMAIQFWCTKTMARIAYGFAKSKSIDK